MVAISIVTVVVSIFSLCVSMKALASARKTNENTERYREEQLRIQREQLRISQADKAREAEARERAEEAKLRSNVGVDYINEGQGNYKVVITAIGPADACNVNMVIHGDDSPVPESEIEARLPATRLSARKTVRLPATGGGLGRVRREWDTTLTWEDPDGTNHSKKLLLRLP